MKILTCLLIALAGCGGATTTIGGNEVPNLNCEEDEAITFVQGGTPPYDLGCVNIDTIKGEG